MQTSIDLNSLSKADLMKRIDQLEAIMKSKLTLKISPKGCVSATGAGLGKWGVTLYASQWNKILSNAQEIQSFIEVNKDKLSFKENEA